MVLTKQQKKVMDYIAGFLRDRGYSPSFQEIATGLGLRSVATVHKHVGTLERKGYLRRGRHRSRSLELGQKYLQDEKKARKELGVLELPLLGRIKSSRLIERVDPPVSIPLIDLTRNGGIFLFQVQGDTFMQDNILAGDYLLIERAPMVADGEIVIVLIDGAECILKRYYKQPDGRIRLASADVSIDPMILPADRVAIQGRAIGVLRLY
ncbi:MAG: repressor LexA [Acidobacteria bacterium RIFCSPLOWO2_12_FULL_54_10]|nr:MAG: repressor LexA [Acidobacteria bacterium RIFCSPLOWO2_12_FULL_54_10]